MTDALATICWCRDALINSKLSSPYALGREVEPETYWSRKTPGTSPDAASTESVKARHHYNRWAKYARGLHRPRPEVVEATERKFPGTARVINAEIWKVLRRPPTTLLAVEQSEAMLAPEVRLVLSRLRQHRRAVDGGPIRRFALALGKMVSLDGLAAMTLMCRSALIRGHQQQATDWAFHVYQHMIRLGPYLLDRGVARPMHELLQTRILNQVVHQGVRFHYPSDAYLEAASFLQKYLHFVRSEERDSRADMDENQRIARLVTGQRWFALHVTLKPYLELNDAGNASPARAAAAQRGAAMFRWAWSTLRTKGVNKDMPTLDELHEFMNEQ